MDKIIEKGDTVRTRTYDPTATYLQFVVTDVASFHGQTMADSEKYGQINVDLLIIIKKANEKD